MECSAVTAGSKRSAVYIQDRLPSPQSGCTVNHLTDRTGQRWPHSVREPNETPSSGPGSILRAGWKTELQVPSLARLSAENPTPIEGHRSWGFCLSAGLPSRAKGPMPRTLCHALARTTDPAAACPLPIHPKTLHSCISAMLENGEVD